MDSGPSNDSRSKKYLHPVLQWLRRLPIAKRPHPKFASKWLQLLPTAPSDCQWFHMFQTFFEIPNPLNVFHLVCKSLELVWSMSNNFERFQTVCLRWGHSFSNALHLISWLPIVLNGLQWLPIAPKRLGSFSLAFATSNDLQKILRLPTLVQGAHDSLMLSTLPHCGRGLFADNTRLRINFERYQEVFIGFISISKGPE